MSYLSAGIFAECSEVLNGPIIPLSILVLGHLVHASFPALCLIMVGGMYLLLPYALT